MHHFTTYWNFHNVYTKKLTEVEQQADTKHFAAMTGPFRALSNELLELFMFSMS